IDHVDIDRVSAETLVLKKPAAVLNAAKSTSGRYPNLGPGILIEAGIPLIDDLGAEVMSIPEGATIRIEDAVIYSPNGDAIAEGVVQTKESVDEAIEQAREGLSA